jgi:hypothetical protein
VKRYPYGLLALAAVLLVTALATQRAAAAGPPSAASGSFTQVSFSQTNVRTTGAVTHFAFTEQDALTGTFSGSTVLQGSCVVQASGRAICQAVESFTGTVAGQTGSLTFRDVIFLDMTTGAAHGSFTIISGTGGLAMLHGHGTFQGVGTTGTYSGALVFAP